MAVKANPEKARQANALGPENLARASRKANAVLMTISTDYVFDGEKEGFYTQRDTLRRSVSTASSNSKANEERRRHMRERS